MLLSSTVRGKTMTFDKYPKMTLAQARKAYIDARSLVEQGKNPLDKTVKRGESMTVNALIDKYLKYCQKIKKKSWKSERQAFKKDLIPAIGNKQVHHVTGEDLMAVFNQIIERGALHTATHLYAYTRRLFNYAGDNCINKMRRRDNPCQDIKLGIKHKSKKRHLSPQEIYLFWHNILKMKATPIVKMALKFMLCTVVRGAEIREFKYDDLDYTQNIWTLPNSKKRHYA